MCTIHVFGFPREMHSCGSSLLWHGAKMSIFQFFSHRLQQKLSRIWKAIWVVEKNMINKARKDHNCTNVFFFNLKNANFRVNYFNSYICDTCIISECPVQLCIPEAIMWQILSTSISLRMHSINPINYS